MSTTVSFNNGWCCDLPDGDREITYGMMNFNSPETILPFASNIRVYPDPSWVGDRTPANLLGYYVRPVCVRDDGSSSGADIPWISTARSQFGEDESTTALWIDGDDFDGEFPMTVLIRDVVVSGDDPSMSFGLFGTVSNPQSSMIFQAGHGLDVPYEEVKISIYPQLGTPLGRQQEVMFKLDFSNTPYSKVASTAVYLHVDPVEYYVLDRVIWDDSRHASVILRQSVFPSSNRSFTMYLSAVNLFDERQTDVPHDMRLTPDLPFDIVVDHTPTVPIVDPTPDTPSSTPTYAVLPNSSVMLNQQVIYDQVLKLQQEVTALGVLLTTGEVAIILNSILHRVSSNHPTKPILHL